MDRLYSRRALFCKGAYSFCLPLLHILITAGEAGDHLLWLLLSTVMIGCLYTVPFWVTVYRLRNEGKQRLLPYIGRDAASCLAPATLSALLYEVWIFLAVDASKQVGLYTLLLFFILSLISGCFWLLYRFAAK